MIALAETLSPEEILTPLSLAKCFAKMREDSKDDHDHNAVTVTTIDAPKVPLLASAAVTVRDELDA